MNSNSSACTTTSNKVELQLTQNWILLTFFDVRFLKFLCVRWTCAIFTAEQWPRQLLIIHHYMPTWHHSSLPHSDILIDKVASRHLNWIWCLNHRKMTVCVRGLGNMSARVCKKFFWSPFGNLCEHLCQAKFPAICYRSAWASFRWWEKICGV